MLLPKLRGPSAWVAPRCRHAEAAPAPEAEAAGSAGSAGSAGTAQQAAGATAAQEVQQAIEEGTQASMVGWSAVCMPCWVAKVLCVKVLCTNAAAFGQLNFAPTGRAAPAMTTCCPAGLGWAMQAATEGLEIASSAAGAAVGGAAGVVASAANAARNLTLEVVGGAAEVRRPRVYGPERRIWGGLAVVVLLVAWLLVTAARQRVPAVQWKRLANGLRCCASERVPAMQVSAPPRMRRLLQLCSAWCRRDKPSAKSFRTRGAAWQVGLACGRARQARGACRWGCHGMPATPG